MTRKNSLSLIEATCCFCLLSALTGCDAVYRLLYKEGAEEKELLGNLVSAEPNPRVEEIQKTLKLYGYNPGAIDGKLGVHTRNAIEKFQKDQNLVVNRLVDRATWERLNMFSKKGLVFQGEINMRQVQMALSHAGMNLGTIDGRPGAQTQQALKAFQKAHGLKPDGVIGFKTLTKLMEYLPDAGK